MDLTRGDVNLGMGGLQVHNGIGRRRLVYKEVVKKSYFWWLGNLACGDSAGKNSIEKDILCLLDLVEGMGKKGHCDLVCGAPVDD